jgi:hypothetical protein
LQVPVAQVAGEEDGALRAAGLGDGLVGGVDGVGLGEARKMASVEAVPVRIAVVWVECWYSFVGYSLAWAVVDEVSAGSGLVVTVRWPT